MIRERLKKVVVYILCVASTVNLLYTAIPVAYAEQNRGSSTILGTNTALGSPLINTESFSVADWNEWETICWGVFLSNFCQPLVDTYETAFLEGKGGSNGKGFNALWGGSGSDASNAEIIKALCNYAIANQFSAIDQIYVSYTPVTNGKLGDKGKDYKEATFRDLWFINEAKDGETYMLTAIQESNLYASEVENIIDYSANFREYTDDGLIYTEYDKTDYMRTGNIPTFYIKRGDKYVVILDYTDWWDIQIVSAMINSVRKECGNAFKSNFEKMWDSDTPLYLDSFANIVTSVSGEKNKLMLVPSAVNQHITTKKSVNMLNSYVVNGYVTSTSTESMVLGLRQHIRKGFGGLIDTEWLRSNSIHSGYPAFGSSNVGDIGMLYYDLDSIMIRAFMEGKQDDIKYGDALSNLFTLDINDNKINTLYPIKFEIAGNKLSKLGSSSSSTDFDKVYDITSIAASMIPNQFYTEGQNDVEILSEILRPDGGKIKLFSEKPVAIAVKALQSTASEEPTNQGAVRKFYNYLYEGFSGQLALNKKGSITQSAMQANLQGKRWREIEELFDDTLAKNFSIYYSKYKSYDHISSLFREVIDAGNNETLDQNTSRIVLAYPVSEVMRQVSSLMGIKDGANFERYCTYVYMTYLDFYGISTTKSLTAMSYTSKFNRDIFTDDRKKLVNITENNFAQKLSEQGADFTSATDINKEIKQMSYLMLSPEKGRKYRQEIVNNAMCDLMYDQYNKMVFGGASTTTGSVSKNKSGFLHIESYSENPITKIVLDNYADIAVVLITVGALLIIIIGIFRGKKFTWIVISFIVLLNTILLTPSSGDLVPYLTSVITQDMFSDKMTHWSISEGIQNSDIEHANNIELNQANANITTEEAKIINSLTRELSMLQTDASLSVKQDISQKIVQQLSDGVYRDIESYKSARWILPMVMQQFTGDNDTESFIYKPLANIWSDMSNIYWYFNPSDAEQTEIDHSTATSGQNEAPSVALNELYNNLDNYYKDVNKEKSSNISNDLLSIKNLNYRCYSYTIKPNNTDQVHLMIPYLQSNKRHAISRMNDKVFGKNGAGYTDVNSWSRYINSVKSYNQYSVSDWNTNSKDGFEYTADSYNRLDRGTITKDMPYLFMTESPIYYFYSVIKDSFNVDDTLGTVVYQLQGTIQEDKDKNEVRSCFMYGTIGTEDVDGSFSNLEYTSYVRDILDLEEFFYNTVPYMYQMQLTTGGFDGKSGVLKDSKITDKMQYYNGELQSWMYRCNWATKIMENPMYSESCKVRDKEGKEYTVKNPMLWECYPSNRPMVFSEAQKQALGLKDIDLSLVELKCIKVNKEVSKKWTLLLNYINSDGITKEILFKQMATDATLEFCKEFSSSGIINSDYVMYPQSLDLRYMSFDSIAKMLVMNSSKNQNYVYGNTMLTLIQDSNIITSLILLITTFVCALIIPFARTVLMAAIFFLGFRAIFKNITADNKTRTKISFAHVAANVWFILYTAVYYFIIKVLISLSSSDEVLSVNNISAETGSPIWSLLIVLILSILYIKLIVKQLSFCIVNTDMGYDAMAFIVGKIGRTISSKIHSVGNTLSKMSHSGGHGKSGHDKSGSGDISGSGAGVKAITNTDTSNVREMNVDEMRLGKKPSESSSTETHTTTTTTTTRTSRTSTATEQRESRETANINSQIRQGERM